MLKYNCPKCGKERTSHDTEMVYPNTIKDELNIVYLFECDSCGDWFDVEVNYSPKNAKQIYSEIKEVEEEISLTDKVEEEVEEKEPEKELNSFKLKNNLELNEDKKKEIKEATINLGKAGIQAKDALKEAATIVNSFFNSNKTSVDGALKSINDYIKNLNSTYEPIKIKTVTPAKDSHIDWLEDSWWEKP